jgi:hypothetical protein
VLGHPTRTPVSWGGSAGRFRARANATQPLWQRCRPLPLHGAAGLVQLRARGRAPPGSRLAGGASQGRAGAGPGADLVQAVPEGQPLVPAQAASAHLAPHRPPLPPHWSNAASGTTAARGGAGRGRWAGGWAGAAGLEPLGRALARGRPRQVCEGRLPQAGAGRGRPSHRSSRPRAWPTMELDMHVQENSLCLQAEARKQGTVRACQRLSERRRRSGASGLGGMLVRCAGGDGGDGDRDLACSSWSLWRRPCWPRRRRCRRPGWCSCRRGRRTERFLR